MIKNKRIPRIIITTAAVIAIIIAGSLFLSRGTKPVSHKTLYAIDIIGKETISNKPRPLGEIQIKVQKDLFVAGWAVDSISKLPSGGVEINIDGKLYPATYGLNRPDVAKAYKIPAYRCSGFTVQIPIVDIGKGQHLLSIKILTNNKKDYFPPREIIKIKII